MTNAVVDSVRSDTALLTQTPKKGGMQGLSSGKDFSTILSQTKNNKQQTSEIKNTRSAKTNPKLEMMTDVSEKNDVASKNTKEMSDSATKEQGALKTEMMEEAKQKPDVEMTGQNVQMGEEDEDMISEEMIETISQTVADLLQNVAEILELSTEELQELMEEIKMAPLDLLNEEKLVGLALAAEGEDSLIGIVMNETIYDNLNDLAQVVEVTEQKLLEETGFTQEELEKLFDTIQKITVSEAERVEDTIEELPADVDEQVVLDVMVPEKNVPESKITDKNNTIQTETGTKEIQPNEGETIVQNAENSQKHQEHHELEHHGNEQETTMFQQNLENVEQIDEMQVENSMTTDSAPSTEHILRQLADFVKVESGKELTEMELQLHPASLGTVHIQLSTKGGVVTAHMTTQNEIVKNVIESQVVSLKNNLEEQGVKVEAIEVSVASHQMEKNLEQGKQGKQEQQNQKTEGIKKIRRANINLNAWMQQEEEEDMEIDEIEAVRIAKEMLEINGNTMDLLA